MAVITTEVRRLPKGATSATNRILTRGHRIREGWKVPRAGGGFLYYETFHYPGALNFQKIVRVRRADGGCPWD